MTSRIEGHVLTNGLQQKSALFQSKCITPSGYVNSRMFSFFVAQALTRTIHWQPGGRVGLPRGRVGFLFEYCEGNPEGIPLKQQSKNIQHKQISLGIKDDRTLPGTSPAIHAFGRDRWAGAPGTNNTISATLR